jgi:hypothetical protein
MWGFRGTRNAPPAPLLALGLALAAAALLGAGAPSASAAVCGDNGTTQLFDSGGYYFDFTMGNTTGPDRNQPFATLYNGGVNGPFDMPPGPVTTSDSYDNWGALFVGPGADASEANLYSSDDNDSCANEDGGREHVYPQVEMAQNGLLVQRKIFVSDAGPLGARILNLISNPTPNVINTDVQVGDTLSSDNRGDLGSDGLTAVRSSSSGDLALTAADRWAVTSDHTGGTTNHDAALAHVIDGPGGRERIDFATLTGTDGTPQDNLAWRWHVRIQPGQTIALVSYEVEQAVASRDAATEDANARDQALAYEAAPPGVLFAGMSTAERAAVANWANPIRCAGRPVTIAGTPGPDAITGTPGPDVIWTGAGDDVVRGLGGNDRICLGSGNDKALGGKGRDFIYGQAGLDRLYGNAGGDRLFGGAGNDLLVGNAGRDGLFGNAGRDALRGLGGRRDLCTGGAGRDLRRAPGCEIRRSIP